MSTIAPPFIAFATHPALRGRFVSARPLVAIHAQSGAIAFANAAGARFFGRGTVAALVDDGPSQEQVVFRQFIVASAGLQEPGDIRTFSIHVARGFRRIAMDVTASLFVLGGERYALLEGPLPQESAIQSLVAGFAPEEAHLAVIGSDGAMRAQSPGFEGTGIDADLLRDAFGDLAAGADTYVERLVTTENGIWPLALGRLSSDLFLLVVSAELADEIASQAAALSTEEAAEPAGQRSARDAIAAIDESLGVLLRAEEEEPAPTNPVIRKVPGEPAHRPEAEDPATERPLRFVWRTDGDGRISEVSGELAEAVGAEMADIIGRHFEELERDPGVIGAAAIARLMDETGTWSGRTVDWPVSGTDTVVPVDLAALPTFTRERHFDGFRGFGLVRRGEERQRPAPVAPQPKAEPAPGLTENERHALDEIASRLRAIDAGNDIDATEDAPVIRRRVAAPSEAAASPPGLDAAHVDTETDAMLIQSGAVVRHANPAFFMLSGYGSLDAVIAAGGTDALVERGRDDRLFLITADGTRLAVSLHLQAVDWQGQRALALTLRPETAIMPSRPAPDTEEVDELGAILETATDGIVTIDTAGNIRTLSTAAGALFGVESENVTGTAFASLFAEESRNAVENHLDRLLNGRAGDLMHEGMEVIGRESSGGLIPLFMTLGRLPRGACAILRDITGSKQREDDLRAARREARDAEEERNRYRTALRHELRQPLEAIISLSETMDEEAFGPVGDQRYHAIAREIGEKSRHARVVVGRLLGEPERDWQPQKPAPVAERRPPPQEAAPVHAAALVNDAIAEAVSVVQPRANARRIIIRAALSPSLAETPSDTETLKQIALELLQEAIHFTPAGGQVVVSTAIAASGETALRFRDNGIAPSRRRSPTADGESNGENPRLARARRLAEGLGARFLVHAVPNEGMLVEVFLPSKEVRSLHY
ncbi:PAS domain S-box protein [Martelella endophytica]|uniref:histidine kinase n=1 Tax=Martelella endophytica TaxID=1486262 RepID=A0A0D5LPS1_MAREN|nr:PAS domain S-box protein [Martelella endophytica]AJY46126.1 hypothetical protein TM49_11265 [Martelella endophytica]